MVIAFVEHVGKEFFLVDGLTMLFDKMLYYPFCAVLNADACQMPHEVVAVAVWAKLALYDFITAIAKLSVEI